MSCGWSPHLDSDLLYKTPSANLPRTLPRNTSANSSAKRFRTNAPFATSAEHFPRTLPRNSSANTSTKLLPRKHFRILARPSRGLLLSTHMKRHEIKWNERMWNEMKWNEMKWDEMNWNEMKIRIQECQKGCVSFWVEAILQSESLLSKWSSSWSAVSMRFLNAPMNTGEFIRKETPCRSKRRSALHWPMEKFAMLGRWCGEECTKTQWLA